MNQHFNPYGEIPNFFRVQCQKFELPLTGITKDISAFVTAVLNLENPVDRTRMHLYLVGDYNYLSCYLQVLARESPELSRQVGREVLLRFQDAGIPLQYRTRDVTK